MTKLPLFLVIYLYTTETEESRKPDIDCLLKMKNWIEDDYLLLTWTLPENIFRYNTSDLQVFAGWYRHLFFGSSIDGNSGTCSQVNLTSCKMIYAENGSPDFNFEFNLTVAIATRDNETLLEYTWLIDNTNDCRQPPAIGSVSARSLNSSCITVRWGYTTVEPNDQWCRNLSWIVYRIRHRPLNKGSVTWQVELTGVKSQGTCDETVFICGLSPNTEYEVGVECRSTYWSGEEYGRWSSIKMTSVQTDKDVPSAAPEVIRSGFSYNSQDCRKGDSRSVTYYWKSLPKGFRHGKVVGYKIGIYRKSDAHSQTLLQLYDVFGDDSASSTALLLCSVSYLVSLKAFTVIGPSEEASTIVIPNKIEVLEVSADVVPVLQDAAMSIRVSMEFHGNFTEDISRYTLFWCPRTLGGECQKAIDWTYLPAGDLDYILKESELLQPVHSYMIGMSVEAANRSSGIFWSKCIYIEDKNVSPPGNVRFREINLQGNLMIVWDNPPCDSKILGPYIKNFIVYICILDRHTEKRCSDALWSKVVDGNGNSVVFTELDPSEYYVVYVIAMTRSKTQSQKSKIIVGKPYTDDSLLTSLQLIIIVIAAVAILVLTFVVIRYSRCMWKKRKQRDITIDDILDDSPNQPLQQSTSE